MQRGQDKADEVTAVLEAHLGEPAARDVPGAADGARSLHIGRHRFLVETRSAARAALVAEAARKLQSAARAACGNVIPLVVVPFMGDVGREICREFGVHYVDLCGNASIEAPGLRIHVSGCPNRFVERGRPSSVFAPKSSRVTRILLLDPRRWWRQGELAERTGLGPGYVSRICTRLASGQLIDRGDRRAVRPRDPGLLLKAWAAEYDFTRHGISTGHVSARSGVELTARLVENCERAGCAIALTGLAAAWRHAPFAGYRLVVAYVHDAPNVELLSRLKWHEESRGANLWLVRPNDDGVFDGATHVQGALCVHPVQAFQDLKGMPERSDEAAVRLQKEHLPWL